jgi:hypothetical protein
MLKSSRAESCGDLPCHTTRQNYYFGKLLTAADLQSEQRYLNEKRWLINRYGIGWGVLCGLEVTVHPQNSCTVCIEPGLALDQYGHEIVVCEAQCSIDLNTARQKLDAEGKGYGGGTNRYYITITYRECATARSPIPVSTCEGYETDYAYNRTLETFKIDVTRTVPEKPRSLREELQSVLTCEAECFAFLNTPGHVVNYGCLPRAQCQPITLACVEFDHATNSILSIDNVTYRKLAYSNELLYSLSQCMLGELRETTGAHHDRRRYIPLLANTIKGLRYQDGKIAEIRNAGVDPFRITTDGDAIWGTDRESTAIIRINRRTNTLQDGIDLGHHSWGIAFDGDAMWITHHEAGMLTRIRACQHDERWTRTFAELPKCNPAEEAATDAPVSLPPSPQELVYHQDLLYVSHGWYDPSGSEYAKNTDMVPHISIIDTRRCCLLKTIPITSTDYTRPVSPILAMVSDGDALWIVYLVQLHGEGATAPGTVLRKIRYGAGDEVSPPFVFRNIPEPGRLAFDGTHLWLTHKDGAVRIHIATGNEDLRTSRTQQQVGLAYGGGEYMWASEAGQGEVRLNRINIFTGHFDGEVQFIPSAERLNAAYDVNDVQFDGAFLYVAGHYRTTPRQGTIHRILP